MTKDEAWEMIDSALDHSYSETDVTAIREALEQPAQEPVAQIIAIGQYEFPALEWFSADHSFRAPIGSLLYTTPPKRQPLTDEEIENIAARTLVPVDFARAIEAAHGIKENT